MKDDEFEEAAQALANRLSVTCSGHENAVVGVALMAIVESLLAAAAARDRDEYVELFDCFLESLQIIKEDCDGGPYGRTH